MPPPSARRWTALAALIAVVALVQPPPSAASTATSYAFHPSGLEGGGFQNTVAYDPFTPDVVLAGGDVSGISRSTDGGRSWTSANTGVPFSMFHVATVAFSTTTPGLVYAGAGKAGRAGGLLRSQDSGRSWQVLSTTPQFSGTNNAGVAGLPTEHPRSTGNLIVTDPIGTIYAGTFSQGVLRSTDNGASWTTLGLAGSHVRSLIGDPNNPSVLYAGTYEGGVLQTATALTDGTFTAVPGSPARVEELSLVDGTVYAAAGTLGLFSYSPLTDSWDRLDSSTLSTPNKIWTTITGYAGCGQSTLYAGSDEKGSNVVVRSTDAGRTWSGLAAGAVHTEVGGPGGHRWWLAPQREFLLTGRSYLTSQLAVAPAGADPCQRPDVVMAGRSGLWGSSDAGASWYPYVRRLGTTFGYGVAADAAHSGRTLAATADWSSLGSVDGFETVRQHSPGKLYGTAVTFGPAGTAYLASGLKDANSGGEVYSNTDITGGVSWRNERLGAVTGGRRPMAISARTVNGATVLLAAVQGSGVWRKSGGAWRQVSRTAGASPSPFLRASFGWSAAGKVVFLYDNMSGLWRSTDAGLTWQRIWSRMPTPGSAGYVAADPSTPGRLYVANGSAGLYRLDGATGGSVDAGTLPAVQARSGPVGPVAVGVDGAVLVSVPAGPDGTGAQLLRSGDGGGSWTDVSDAAYRAAGGQASGIALDRNGTLYVVLSGNGVVTGVPTG